MSKQAPTITDLPPQRHGESDEAHYRRIVAFLNDVRTKTDLVDWTGLAAYRSILIVQPRSHPSDHTIRRAG